MAFTFFFRDMNTMDIVEKHVIPDMKQQRCFDIWDAGCATGAEPYTLAIILRENMGQFTFRNVRIYATDLNGNFGDIIGKGEYPSEQVGRIPPDILGRYFSPLGSGDCYVVNESLRKAIRFQQHDLTSLQPVKQGFGLVLCKNVLLHLSPTQRVDVLRMFRDALVPGGYLALENTQRLPEEAQGWFRPLIGTGPVFQRC